jgi:hypothetical protein
VLTIGLFRLSLTGLASDRITDGDFSLFPACFLVMPEDGPEVFWGIGGRQDKFIYLKVNQLAMVSGHSLLVFKILLTFVTV